MIPIDPMTDPDYLALHNACVDAGYDDAERALLYRLMADWWEDRGHEKNAAGFRRYAEEMQ